MSYIINKEDSNQVVALLIGNDIYFGQAAIDKARNNQCVDNVYTRAVFKFMSWADLGPQWEEYAQMPTLFTLSELEEFIKKEK